jgi:hypothetical protein
VSLRLVTYRATSLAAPSVFVRPTLAIMDALHALLVRRADDLEAAWSMVYARRPNDADLLNPAIESHRTKLGRTRDLVAADAGFCSAENVAASQAKVSNASAFPTARPGTRSARTEETLVS